MREFLIKVVQKLKRDWDIFSQANQGRKRVKSKPFLMLKILLPQILWQGGKKKAAYDWVCYCVILKHDLNLSNYRIFQVNQSCYRTEKASLSFALQENVGDMWKGKTCVTCTLNRFCVIVICWSNPEQYGLFCSVCGLIATMLKYSITREKPSNKQQNHNSCHLKFPPFCWHLLF